ncbi:hypothetical protein PAQ31011_01836 [Pandoraea aquatica]|uniref:RiboL-PSP-HEPN domain-containing protein n=1 Tax=Pandoraea aquatica TaxID=2508290 RepID=A0A5E4U4G5_9BURK|nr:HEPN domain-containing protein [Pandoraea aquatica]VVD94925.1 hypothetical protein PAQ31011_01836 [Pandoraea aquatica]
MDDVDAMTVIHDYLAENKLRARSLDDVLRSKVVSSVSAFDRLLHDVIHTGMVDIYAGQRASTPKYLGETIPIGIVVRLKVAGDSPNDNVFSRTIQNKLRALSFQSPDKVADGLSYIWAENRKWQKIAAVMGEDETYVRATLETIVRRRNSIAHEADMDAEYKFKRSIDLQLTTDFARFIRKLGETIHGLVH